MSIGNKSIKKLRLGPLSNQSFIRSLKTSPFVKLALFSVNACFLPKWLSAFVFVFSQVQLFSVFVNTALLSFPDNKDWLREILVLIHQVCSIGELWDIDKEYKLTLAALAVILVIALLEVFCMVFLILSILKPRLSVLRIERAWCFFTNIHTYILFYPIHFIGSKTLSVIWEDIVWDSNLATILAGPGFKVLMMMLLLWNFIYSAGTLGFLSPKIKTKNLLSSHTRLIDFLDLIMKATSPILWFFSSGPASVYTGLLALNLFSSLLRDGMLFWFLPYYSISILKVSAYFHAVISVYSFSAIMPKMIIYTKTLDAPLFSTLLFVMAAPLLIKLYSKQLQQILINILTNPTRINSYHLLHHWDVCKHFSLEARKKNSDHPLYHYGSTLTDLPFVKEILSSENTTNFRDPKITLLIRKHLFNSSLGLLRAASQKSKHKQTLKCCLAWYYSKHEAYYVLADDLVNAGVKTSFSVSLTLSFYLIRIELYKKVNGMRGHTQDPGQEKEVVVQSHNMQKYFQMFDVYEYLKSCIAEQLKPQIKFWENYQAQEPDCYLMLNLAKEIYNKAKNVKKGWLYYKNFSDSQFTQPYLMFGLYYSFVLNDFELGDRFLQIYYNTEARNNIEGKILTTKMSMQVLYNSIQLSVSGYPGSFGKIIECSNNVEKFLDYKKGMILGKPVNTLVPSLFSEKHDSTTGNHLSKLTEFLKINKSKEALALDKSGYLVSCRVYSALKFLKEGTLCYSILLCPLKDKKRIVNIRSNGKMVNCSKGFKKDLGFTNLERTNLNLFSLCPKLKQFLDEFVMNYNKENDAESPIKEKLDAKDQEGSLALKDSPRHYSLSGIKRKNTSDRIGESCHSVNDDEIFMFYYPLRSTLLAKIKHKAVPYHVKVESCVREGDIVVTIGLSKVYTNKKAPELIPQSDILVSVVQGQVLSEPKQSAFHEEIMTPSSVKKDLQVNEENSLSPQLRGKLRPINTTFFSEENEENKLLNTVTSGRNALNLSPTLPIKLESKLEVVNSEVQSIQKKGTMDSNENSKQFETKLKIVVKPNNGDSPSVVIGDSFLELEKVKEPNIPVNQIAIKPRAKKDKIEASEEDFVRKFLDKDATKFRQKAKTHKDIQQVLEQRKYKRSAIIYIIIFGLAMIVELILSVWLNMDVLGASKDAANLSEVLQATFFRTYWLNLANMEDRLWLGLLYKWSIWEMELQIEISNLTYTRFNAHNQMFKRSVSNLSPELQYLFFEKNIHVYERNEKNELVAISLDNHFQIVDRILDRAVRNMNKGLQIPDDPPEFSIFSDSQFIYDNSYDELYLVSDKLIEAVKDDLFGNLSKARKDMTIFLVIALMLIGVFVAYSFKFVIEINNEYRYFLKIFLSLSSREVKKTEILLLNFYDMVKGGLEGNENNPGSDSVRIHANHLKSAAVANTNLEPNQSPSRRNVSNASLTKLNRKTWFLLLHLNVAVFGVLAFMLVYYTRALNEITTIDNHQRHINSALENLNKEILVGTQIQALVMDNGTSTIRHQPILQALQDNLNSLQAVNEILNNLRDQNGQLSPRQQQIFFNLTCSEAYTPFYIVDDWLSIDACNAVSRGAGNLGLANIIPEFSTKIQQYLLDFENINKDMQGLQQLYEQIPNSLLGLVDICTVFFLLSFEATITEYQVLMNDLEDQRTTLAWVAVAISLVLSILLWFLVVKKLIHKTFETKDILKLVPVKLILKTFLLKKYVSNLEK